MIANDLPGKIRIKVVRYPHPTNIYNENIEQCWMIKGIESCAQMEQYDPFTIKRMSRSAFLYYKIL